MLSLLIVCLSLRTSICYIGLTRSALYEENEITSIAWKNEDIPSNLRAYFKFNGTNLIISPPNGLSFEFVIARPVIKDDNFVAQWCAPSAEEYAKCDNDIMLVGNTFNESSYYNFETSSLNLTSSGFIRKNSETHFRTTYGRTFPNIAIPSVCHRIVVEFYSQNTFHKVHQFINYKWEFDNSGGQTLGGLKYIPLPGHPEYHQSGRMLNGDFCGKPFLFPDTGVVFQKAMRRINNVHEIIEPLTTEIPLNVSNTTAVATDNDSFVSTSLNYISIDYLIPAIFGGICTGLLFISLICFIGYSLIQHDRKETFVGRPSFSLESFDDSNSAPIKFVPILPTEADPPPSSKQKRQFVV
uniref:Uncharacterized protein n=1 Tax=Panagrolaimus sp. ES5 TaxID=591445 RepID=A0AC34FRR3_9BILA